MCRALRTQLALLMMLWIGLTSSAIAEPIWNPLGEDGTSRTPSATVLRSDASETVVRFTIPGFWSEEVREGDRLFQAVTLSRGGTTLEVGRPALPALSELIGIPLRGGVELEILETREVVLEGYTVHPFQEPRLGTEQRAALAFDAVAYARDELYPANIATVGTPGIWRDLRVVDLRVHPLRYNPVSKEIFACSEMTLRLSYDSTSPDPSAALAGPIPASAATMYRGAVLNYDALGLQIEDEVLSKDGTYDYLIIAADEYMDAMAPFVDYKNAQGLVTVMVPASGFGANPETIKAYIQDIYGLNHNRYVLFVGNEDAIPPFDYGQFDSDYWYALLEGDDNYAEIGVGRFCVENLTQLQNMISKTMVYESDPPGGEWLENSVLIAHLELAPESAQLCKEMVRTAGETLSGTYNILYPNFVTAYGASVDVGGDEASNADVIAYIDAGQRVVNYSGHGGIDCFYNWNVYGEDFDIDDVATIDNGQMTPVVFGIACTTNKFGGSETCLGEAFTQGDDAAVAYLGASERSYAVVNKTYDKKLYAAVFDEGVNAAADASNVAAVKIILDHGQWGVRNARLYLWMGDPSLQIVFGGVVPPPGPVLTSHDDGVTTTNRVPVLTWTTVGDDLYYEVELDDDPDFSSLVRHATEIPEPFWRVEPYLDLGTWYWRVRALVDGAEPIWSDWSAVGTFTTVPDNPSCPVLFVRDAGGFLPENTLLTACEASGYRDEVTDYYRLPDFVRPVDGRLTLQLRELENETSYLRDLELIAVHHPLDTRVACSTEGRLVLHAEPTPPLSAFDEKGVDRLAEVRDRDGLFFQSAQSGHLVLKFPYPEDGIFKGPIDPTPKRQCPQTKAAAPEEDRTQLRLQVLLPDGSWSSPVTAPPREWLHEELFYVELPPAPADRLVTVRLSWDGAYRADSMFSLESVDGRMETTRYAIVDHELLRASPRDATWSGFDGSDLLLLDRGDVFEFSFDPDPSVGEGCTTYILEAVGRYEPLRESAPDRASVGVRFGGNYPNPFNPNTTLHYELPTSMHVKVEIYDLAGRHVATLVDEIQLAGGQRVVWNGEDAAGHAVASGTYFVRLTAGREIVSRKLTLMK